MALIDEALRSMLVGDSGVTAIVSTRVFNGQVPQNTALDALSFSRITAQRSLAHHGPTAMTDSIFQISCWASSLLNAKNLAAAVRRLLHGFRGTVATVEIGIARVINEIDSFDPETGVYLIAVEAALLHRET